MRIKTRYMAAALLVIISIFATPWAVAHAYEFRGYNAIGGEWLIIPMGIFLAYVTLRAAKERDGYTERYTVGRYIEKDFDCEEE
jgi:hypothetical protein